MISERDTERGKGNGIGPGGERMAQMIPTDKIQTRVYLQISPGNTTVPCLLYLFDDTSCYCIVSSGGEVDSRQLTCDMQSHLNRVKDGHKTNP
jgi:hypothetical protein